VRYDLRTLTIHNCRWLLGRCHVDWCIIWVAIWIWGECEAKPDVQTMAMVETVPEPVMAPTRVGARRKECAYGQDGHGKDDTNTDSHTHTSLYRTGLLVLKV